MKEITKEFHGDGSKIKLLFPCTKSGCGEEIDKIFDKPASKSIDVTASCICDTNYEITIEPYAGNVSGVVTIRDVNNKLLEKQVKLNVI